LPPIHPGAILRSQFLEAMNLSQNRLARDLSVPPKRINEIVHGLRAITADTALRLARRFATSPQFWMNLQTQFDLETAQDALRGRLAREVRTPTVARKRASRNAA
jgi:addiction module HigA family antidote